ncbi:MAG: DUF1697 domain-containing protein [Verrucomicrobiia bacterium]
MALLRGINVGGQKPIKMADLQSHFASGGAVNVRTYIQSRNVVFEHREKSAATLRKILEQHLAAKLGYAVPTLVRTAEDFAAIAGANPYDTHLPGFGRRMYVCFFEKAPAASAIAEIQSLVTDAERLVVKGVAGYAYYTTGLGRAKLTSNVIERKLGLATLRNWNTVTALLKMSQTRS